MSMGMIKTVNSLSFALQRCLPQKILFSNSIQTSAKASCGKIYTTQDSTFTLQNEFCADKNIWDSKPCSEYRGSLKPCAASCMESCRL